MSHAVVRLLRAAPGQPWRRIDGFLTQDALLAQYRRLVAASSESVGQPLTGRDARAHGGYPWDGRRVPVYCPRATAN